MWNLRTLAFRCILSHLPWQGKAAQLPLGAHYESDISIAPDPVHGMIVRKRYRDDVECVRWLNRHLASYYADSGYQPVAQHEFAALQLLDPHGFVPTPLELRRDSVVMRYAGLPLMAAPPIDPASYRAQCEKILQTLTELHFRHNDLLIGNVLVQGDKIRICDFTLSEFGNVSIMNQLPDSRWARPGEDHKLLHYLDERVVS